MKKRKGWSATKVGGRTAQRSIMMAAVAAAASVPSSLTSTKALWTTFDRTRSLAGDMPVSRRDGLNNYLNKYNAWAHPTPPKHRAHWFGRTSVLYWYLFIFLWTRLMRSYQRSHSSRYQKHPPCPCWPGHSSCHTSPPSWTGAAPPGPQFHPSCLDESAPQSSHR